VQNLFCINLLSSGNFEFEVKNTKIGMKISVSVPEKIALCPDQVGKAKE